MSCIAFKTTEIRVSKKSQKVSIGSDHGTELKWMRKRTYTGFAVYPSHTYNGRIPVSSQGFYSY